MLCANRGYKVMTSPKLSSCGWSLLESLYSPYSNHSRCFSLSDSRLLFLVINCNRWSDWSKLGLISCNMMSQWVTVSPKAVNNILAWALNTVRPQTIGHLLLTYTNMCNNSVLVTNNAFTWQVFCMHRCHLQWNTWQLVCLCLDLGVTIVDLPSLCPVTLCVLCSKLIKSLC